MIGQYGTPRMVEGSLYAVVVVYYLYLIIWVSTQPKPRDRSDQDIETFLTRLYGSGVVLSGFMSAFALTGYDVRSVIYIVAHVMSIILAAGVTILVMFLWGFVSQTGTYKEVQLAFYAFVGAVATLIVNVAVFYVD